VLAGAYEGCNNKSNPEKLGKRTHPAIRKQDPGRAENHREEPDDGHGEQDETIWGQVAYSAPWGRLRRLLSQRLCGRQIHSCPPHEPARPMIDHHGVSMNNPLLYLFGGIGALIYACPMYLAAASAEPPGKFALAVMLFSRLLWCLYSATGGRSWWTMSRSPSRSPSASRAIH
jgi:hypothetical protein